MHRMVMERESDREWSVRDRGVLAEAMQDGMDFNRVARMLGREVDEGGLSGGPLYKITQG